MTNINGLGPPQPSMTVSYKMDITTYGTHNGVFITTGIQSGGANGVSPWGYFHAQQYPSGAAITQVTGAGQPMIQAPPITPMPNQGFGGSTLNVSGASTTRSQPQIAGTSRSRSGSRSRSRSRPGSPDFDDSPPDEFLQPEKVQLNVFNPDTTIQTRDRGKSYVTYPTDYVLNDTTTTTTQVEVFRAKVDRNDPIDYFKLPPDPLGPDQRPMIVRAVGPPYEVQTRTETRFSDRPVTSRPGSRVQWESETDLRSIGHGADSTLSRRSQIGSGAGQYPQIGSGVGYHQPRIGSGTSLDQRIGSGTSLNQPRIGSGTSLNQPRIGSGAEIDRPRIGSGASYNSPSPNIGYGTSPGYPLRRVGSDFDWEERRFVGPNELTSYERSRSQSPITVDPTRPSYGLRDTDTYTATILRKQWTEDRDQRIQHKDNLGRRRSPSPPSGADATTYPPRIGNGVEAKRQPRQLHHTKSHQDVFQDPKRRYDYPPDYREDFRREYTTREIQKPGIQSSFSEGYERRRRESRSPDRSYIQQDQYRTRTYSPAGERYRDAHGSRKNQYDRDPPRDHHYHRSRRHSKSPDRYRRVSPRARSETRLQQQEAEGQSYRRVQNPYRAQGPTSTSPYSTLSRPRSREDATETYDLKLYQTRDCLGNILYNL